MFAPALTDLNRAVSLNPSYIGARLWRAVALFALGDKENASRDILEACRCGPKEAETIRGWARWALPRFSDAPGKALGK